MYLSTSTADFPQMFLSTFQVLYKLYLSTDELKYKVLLPGSGVDLTSHRIQPTSICFSQALDIIGRALSDPRVRAGHRYSLFLRAQRLCRSYKVLKNRWTQFEDDKFCKVMEAPKACSVAYQFIFSQICVLSAWIRMLAIHSTVCPCYSYLCSVWSPRHQTVF